MDFKAIWYSIKIFFGRTGSFLYMGLRLYAIWSKVYQYLKQRRFRHPIKVYRNYQEVSVALRGGSLYRADGTQELGDAIAHPEYSQYVLDTGQAPMGFDCDDHAIWIVRVLNYALGLGQFADLSIRAVKFLTVMWITADGKMEGHNVALLEYMTQWGTTFAYMDYGHPSQRRLYLEDVLDDIRAGYGGIGALSLGWALHDENLKLLEVHWK